MNIASYKIDGVALLPPDQGVMMYYEDLDGLEAGRDESGYMHRIVVRNKLCRWEFTYSHLSQQDYARMQQALSCPAEFVFTYPDPQNPEKSLQTHAYLSKYGVAWYNARTGQYRNLKFTVIQC